MSVKVIVQFKAKEDRQKAFEAILRSVSIDLPGVSGCQGVEVLQDHAAPSRFTLVETWDSADIHKAHIDGLVADGTWEAIAAHLAEDPVSGYFERL